MLSIAVELAEDVSTMYGIQSQLSMTYWQAFQHSIITFVENSLSSHAFSNEDAASSTTSLTLELDAGISILIVAFSGGSLVRATTYSGCTSQSSKSSSSNWIV